VLTPNPQVDVIQLEDGLPVMISSDPITANDGGDPDAMPDPIPPALIPTELTFDDVTWDLLNVSNLHLDLLNGVTPEFSIDPLFLELIISGAFPGSLDITLDAKVLSLGFWQDADSTITVNPDGTFEIPGKIMGTFDGTAEALSGAVEVATFEAEAFESDIVLVGTVTATAQGGPDPQDVLVSFDGDIDLNIPLDIPDEVIAFGDNNVGATGTINLFSSVNLAVSYHLETMLEDVHVVIPEPSSVVLLGLGLIALIPVARRKLRK
jgi:hypothetical protein